MGKIDDGFMTLPPRGHDHDHAGQSEILRAAGQGRQDRARAFVVIANTEADDGGKAIVAGNERVLRARLSRRAVLLGAGQEDPPDRTACRHSTASPSMPSSARSATRCAACARWPQSCRSASPAGDAGPCRPGGASRQGRSGVRHGGRVPGTPGRDGALLRAQTRGFPTPWPTRSPITTSLWGPATFARKPRSASPSLWPTRSTAWSASFAIDERPDRLQGSVRAAPRGARHHSADPGRTSFAWACARSVRAGLSQLQDRQRARAR